MDLHDGFVFYRPSEQLRRYVRYYWVLRSDATFDELTFPIGCPQLIFHKKTPFYIPELCANQPVFAVSGQVNFPSRLQSSGGLEMIVAVFHPHALGVILGMPASELYNMEVSGYDLPDRSLAELAARVYDTADVSECVRLIESWLLSAIYSRDLATDSRRVEAALGMLLSDTGTRVEAMAECACLGPRQFGRVFRSMVGMGPKEYAKIARFQKSLWMMQGGERDFASIAYACGYADQSHFIRDCRIYSGHTPLSLLEVTGGVYSDLYSSPM